MADSQTKHVSFEQIFIDIHSENLDKLSKERLQYYCNAPKLKVSGDTKELTQKLEPLAKCKKLFTKKVAAITKDYKFSTALDSNLIPPPSANWKVIGRNKDEAVPIVTESTIKDYQKAKYAAGGKGSTERLTNYSLLSVKATESSEHSGALYVKGNILKSYTGSVSRPATILFVNNILVKVYCGCAVGKSGVCCHVIALLIQLLLS